MIAHELLEKINGFDDCVTFWCSDDVVIEQVKEVGVQPMLVPKAVVDHQISVTLRQSPDRDDLTWRQIDIFNRKYGPHRLSNDPRFLAWKGRNP
jgi:GT2 family glycosyltransferase